MTCLCRHRREAEV